MIAYALITHRLEPLSTMVFLTSLLLTTQGAAQTQPLSAGVSETNNLANLIRKNEAKWKATYKHELDKPVLEPIIESRLYMPDFLQAITIGMGEREMQKIRANAKDLGFAGPMLRDAYEFVPGTITEDVKDPSWTRAIYAIHRRHLAGVTLSSGLFVDVNGANDLSQKLFAKYLVLKGRPNEMRLANNVWGQPNRAVLIWRNGDVFVALMQGQSDKNEMAVTLLIGATSYFDDLMKYYSFSDQPRAEIEWFVRERFPFLQKTVDLEKAK